MLKETLDLFLKHLLQDGHIQPQDAQLLLELLQRAIGEYEASAPEIRRASSALFRDIHKEVAAERSENVVEVCRRFEKKPLFRDVLEKPMRLSRRLANSNILKSVRDLGGRWIAVPYPPVNALLRLLMALDEGRNSGTPRSFEKLSDLAFRFLRELSRILGFVYYPSRGDLVQRMTAELRKQQTSRVHLIAATPSLAFHNEFAKWGEQWNSSYLEALAACDMPVTYVWNKQTTCDLYNELAKEPETELSPARFVERTAMHLVRYAGARNLSMYLGDVESSIFGRAGNISMYSRGALMFTARDKEGGLCALCHERELDQTSSIIPLVGIRAWLDFWNGLRSRAPEDMEKKLARDPAYVVLKRSGEEMTVDKAREIVEQVLQLGESSSKGEGSED